AALGCRSVGASGGELQSTTSCGRRAIVPFSLEANHNGPAAAAVSPAIWNPKYTAPSATACIAVVTSNSTSVPAGAPAATVALDSSAALGVGRFFHDACFSDHDDSTRRRRSVIAPGA